MKISMLKVLVISLIFLVLVSYAFLKKDQRSFPQGSARVFKTIGGAKVSVLPEKAVVKQDQEVKLKLLVDSQNYSVSAVDLTIFFDKDKLAIKDFIWQKGSSTQILKKLEQKEGRVRLVGVVEPGQNIQRGVFELGELIFQSSSKGKAKVILKRENYITQTKSSDNIFTPENNPIVELEIQ